jgi:hypothetical protein
MDASKITQLNQQRANIYINRSQQSQDASLITYNNMIQASRYLPQTTTVPPPAIPANVPGCLTCGPMSTTNIQTNGNPQPPYPFNPSVSNAYIQTTATTLRPNPYRSSKGNQSQTFSCDYVTLKQAGDNYCGTSQVSQIKYPEEQFIELPKCFCNNVPTFLQGGVPGDYSVPDPKLNPNWLNPYLPIPNPYIANTEPKRCISCSHYKIIDEKGQIVDRNTVDPRALCPKCPRSTDPNVLP